MADPTSPADFGGTLRSTVRVIENAQFEASKVALALRGMSSLMLVDGSLTTGQGFMLMLHRDELMALCDILADKLTEDLDLIEQQISVLRKEGAS